MSSTMVASSTETQPAVGPPSVVCRKNAPPLPGTAPCSRPSRRRACTAGSEGSRCRCLGRCRTGIPTSCRPASCCRWGSSCRRPTSGRGPPGRTADHRRDWGRAEREVEREDAHRGEHLAVVRLGRHPRRRLGRGCRRRSAANPQRCARKRPSSRSTFPRRQPKSPAWRCQPIVRTTASPRRARAVPSQTRAPSRTAEPAVGARPPSSTGRVSGSSKGLDTVGQSCGR